MQPTMNSVAQSGKQVNGCAQLHYTYIPNTQDDLELTSQERADLIQCYQQAKQAPILADHPGFLFSAAMYTARKYDLDCNPVRADEARAEARTWLKMWREIRALTAAIAERDRAIYWGNGSIEPVR